MSRTSSTDQWMTPPLVAEAFLELGEVGLDPCTNWYSLVPARLNIMLQENADVGGPDESVIVGDGLAFDWNGHGLVFINPPFSNPAPWIKKAAVEGDEVVMLIPASTAEGWWKPVVEHFDAVLFLEGRLRFYEVDANGNVVPGRYKARTSSALLYRGHSVERFREVFDGCGWFVPVQRKKVHGLRLVPNLSDSAS